MLTKQGYKCEITHNASRIWNTKGQLVIQVSALSPMNNLHWFQSLMITPINGVLSSLARQNSYDLWHTCFGHLLKNALQQAPLHVTGLSTISIPVSSHSCKGCAMEKMADRPFMSSDKRAARPLALVHMDLIGPMPVEPCSHAKYILTFIDDHSGYALVAFLCNKDATAQHFQSMACWAETFTGQSLTSVHSDHGGEFLGKELQMFFSSRGITHQTSVPHTPQWNGHAERFNQTLLEKAKAIQQHACLPRSFWQDSPPSSSLEEDMSPHGPKSWLPPKQSADESLPEFRGRPHQHRPTIDEQSTFRPPVQHQSARIPISRVLPNNTYGDRPPIHIEHDLE